MVLGLTSVFEKPGDLVAVAAARRQPGAVVENHGELAVRPGLQLLDAIDIDNRRAVNAEKARGVELALHAAHGVLSSSAAMSDAFDTHQDRVAQYRERLRYVDGATGMAVAVGEKVVALDVFDKASTCRKVWDRLLSGVVFDAMIFGRRGRHSHRWDSNPQPAVYKTAALPIELRWPWAESANLGH